MSAAQEQLKALEDLPFFLSKNTRRFLDRARDKILNEDSQVIGILFGKVGSGKSVVAQKWGYYISPTLSMDKIAFDKSQFIQAVLKSRKECIIADEGIAIFFGRAAMTKEGRLMAEIMGQIRQKNLIVFICIPDILSVDSSILAQADFIARVYETRKLINGRMVTIKGNVDLYPHLKNYSFKDRFIQYMKLKRNNPLVNPPKPLPCLREPGEPYGETFKDAFYAVDKAEYIAKKESILKKYQGSIDKQPRHLVDYAAMDKLIKKGVTQAQIAKTLSCSMSSVAKRSLLISKKKR